MCVCAYAYILDCPRLPNGYRTSWSAVRQRTHEAEGRVLFLDGQHDNECDDHGTYPSIVSCFRPLILDRILKIVPIKNIYNPLGRTELRRFRFK